MASRTPFADPADWEQRREVISDLYNKHELKEVMRIMEEEHGFRASARMYKARLHRWGLGKYNRQAEMEAVARKGIGKDKDEAVCLVRGQVRTNREAGRYFRRKRMRIENIAAQQSRARTPPTVEALPATARSALVHIPSQISPPRDLSTLEQSLYWLRKYLVGAFDANFWVLSSDSEYIRPRSAWEPGTSRRLLTLAERLSRCYTAACDHLHSGSPGANFEVSRYLNIAFAEIEQLSQYDSHYLISCLQDMILCGNFYKAKPELVRQLLEHVADFFEHCHGLQHPFQQHCRLLMYQDASTLDHALCKATELVWHCFAKKLGPTFFDTVRARDVYIRGIIGRRGPNAERAAISKMVQECIESESSSEGCTSTPVALACLFEFHRRQGDVANMQKELARIIVRDGDMALGGIISDSTELVECILAHANRSLCAQENGDLGEAIRHKRLQARLESIRMKEVRTYVLLGKCMLQLVVSLEQAGNLVEAQSVRREREHVMNKMLQEWIY